MKSTALSRPPREHGASPAPAPPQPLPASSTPAVRRLVVGVDAADVAGVAAWEVTDDPVRLDAREGANFVAALTVRRDRAGFTEADAIALVDELLGEAVWMAVVEKPFGVATAWINGRKVKRGTPPTAAHDFWCRVLDLVARRRAQRAGRAFRTLVLVKPTAGSWRSPLGVATSGDVKASAVAWLHRLGVAVPEHNAAEGACIAAYGARLARGSVIVAPGAKPQAMRWVP